MDPMSHEPPPLVPESAGSAPGRSLDRAAGYRAAPYDLLHPDIHRAMKRYWRTNVGIMLVLLAVWAVVGLGCGVLWADWLNSLTVNGKPFRLGGFPLGFWFAQQGSIIVFVGLILVYAVLLNLLDRRHHLEIERLRRQREASP